MKTEALEDKSAARPFPRFSGLIAAAFTPFHRDGSVNLDCIPRLGEFFVQEGISGVFVCGTTGEGVLLSAKERMAIAEKWVASAPRDFKVIVHVGHLGLEVSEALAKHAQEIGAWGTSAMAPSFFKPETIEDLVLYCAELAEAAPRLPFYYYHIPEMTGVCFPMFDFLQAARDRIPNLAGLKYTGTDLMDFELCRMVDGGNFDILFGRDELLICALALGAEGAIGSTYNFAAPLFKGLIEAFRSCNLPEARRLQRLAIQLVCVLRGCGASFNAAAKAVMKMRGVDCGPVRMPLRDLTPQQYASLEGKLEEIGFFEICPR